MKQTHKEFRFEKFHFSYKSGMLVMHYSYDGTRHYTEKVRFQLPEDQSLINKKVVDALCFFTFVICGSSYYKSFLCEKATIVDHDIDYWQADFFNMIYRGGLSQLLYENAIAPNALAKFYGQSESSTTACDYDGAGVLLMQSGGKDSLLAAELMKEAGNEFTSWHMSSTGQHPQVIDAVGKPVIVNKRQIDLQALNEDKANGAYNGHVPFSAMYAGFALIQAALMNMNLVMASNERSADQANVVVDGYEINHQFTKTFEVELAIQSYLDRYVSPEIHYGSVLRPLNELQVAGLFAEKGWPQYRHLYSSCNLANYKQGKDGGKLTWDGTCPKCANTFVLMAPFVEKDELLDLFSGKNLLQDEALTETYKQLLGLAEVKPFECVGTFEELQEAYNLAVAKDEAYKNPAIETRDVNEDLYSLGKYQEFFDEFLDFKKLI